jgi:hypothetical protein
MTNGNSGDQKNWKLGKAKERQSDSRFELEPEQPTPKKEPVRPRVPKRDPRQREALGPVDTSDLGLEEEPAEQKPVVPIGKPIEPKPRKPWTTERVLKHPVTIILATIVVCSGILYTLWPRLGSYEGPDYSLVYDHKKPGLALVEQFVYQEEFSGPSPYVIGYEEFTGLREARFLAGIGDVFVQVGERYRATETLRGKVESVYLLDLAVKPGADDLQRRFQEDQYTERFESISDIVSSLEVALLQNLITREELRSAGDILLLQGRALLDSELETPEQRRAFGVEGANDRLIEKGSLNFGSFRPKLEKALYPPLAQALYEVHARYY